MSSLRTIEKRYFEDLFGMSSGYVLEFTNNTFAEFFRENVHINIYDVYCRRGICRFSLRNYANLDTSRVEKRQRS